MPLKVYAGLISLGRGHYLAIAGGYVKMIYPWDGQEPADLTFPGHARSTGKTVIVLADDRKLLVSLKPETVADRYAKAIQGGAEPVRVEAAAEQEA